MATPKRKSAQKDHVTKEQTASSTSSAAFRLPAEGRDGESPSPQKNGHLSTGHESNLWGKLKTKVRKSRSTADFLTSVRDSSAAASTPNLGESYFVRVSAHRRGEFAQGDGVRRSKGLVAVGTEAIEVNRTPNPKGPSRAHEQTAVPEILVDEAPLFNDLLSDTQVQRVANSIRSSDVSGGNSRQNTYYRGLRSQGGSRTFAERVSAGEVQAQWKQKSLSPEQERAQVAYKQQIQQLAAVRAGINPLPSQTPPRSTSADNASRPQHQDDSTSPKRSSGPLRVPATIEEDARDNQVLPLERDKELSSGNLLSTSLVSFHQNSPRSSSTTRRSDSSRLSKQSSYERLFAPKSPILKKPTSKSFDAENNTKNPTLLPEGKFDRQEAPKNSSSDADVFDSTERSSASHAIPGLRYTKTIDTNLSQKHESLLSSMCSPAESFVTAESHLSADVPASIVMERGYPKARMQPLWPPSDPVFSERSANEPGSSLDDQANAADNALNITFSPSDEACLMRRIGSSPELQTEDRQSLAPKSMMAPRSQANLQRKFTSGIRPPMVRRTTSELDKTNPDTPRSPVTSPSRNLVTPSPKSSPHVKQGTPSSIPRFHAGSRAISPTPKSSIPSPVQPSQAMSRGRVLVKSQTSKSPLTSLVKPGERSPALRLSTPRKSSPLPSPREHQSVPRPASPLAAVTHAGGRESSSAPRSQQIPAPHGVIESQALQTPQVPQAIQALQGRELSTARPTKMQPKTSGRGGVTGEDMYKRDGIVDLTKFINSGLQIDTKPAEPPQSPKMPTSRDDNNHSAEDRGRPQLRPKRSFTKLIKDKFSKGQETDDEQDEAATIKHDTRKRSNSTVSLRGRSGSLSTPEMQESRELGLDTRSYLRAKLDDDFQSFKQTLAPGHEQEKAQASATASTSNNSMRVPDKNKNAAGAEIQLAGPGTTLSSKSLNRSRALSNAKDKSRPVLKCQACGAAPSKSRKAKNFVQCKECNEAALCSKECNKAHQQFCIKYCIAVRDLNRGAEYLLLAPGVVHPESYFPNLAKKWENLLAVYNYEMDKGFGPLSRTACRAVGWPLRSLRQTERTDEEWAVLWGYLIRRILKIPMIASIPGDLSTEHPTHNTHRKNIMLMCIQCKGDCSACGRKCCVLSALHAEFRRVPMKSAEFTAVNLLKEDFRAWIEHKKEPDTHANCFKCDEEGGESAGRHYCPSCFEMCPIDKPVPEAGRPKECRKVLCMKHFNYHDGSCGGHKNDERIAHAAKHDPWKTVHPALRPGGHLDENGKLKNPGPYAPMMNIAAVL